MIDAEHRRVEQDRSSGTEQADCLVEQVAAEEQADGDRLPLLGTECRILAVPGVAEVLERLKEPDYRRAARVCQNIESRIMRRDQSTEKNRRSVGLPFPTSLPCDHGA